LDYGEIIHELIEELGINKFDVLGFSVDTLYGYAIAKACSDKVRNFLCTVEHLLYMIKRYKRIDLIQYQEK
jgi:hypothetical protein